MPEYDFEPVVFLSNVSSLKDEKLLKKAYDSVSEERRKKTDRYRFFEDKRLSLGAEVLLKYALSYLGLSVSIEEIVCDENKKPCFKDNGVYFNLSHSGDYAMCAVSPCEIGCDIEKIKPLKLGVAERFFTENEYRHILSEESDEKKNGLFYRYWTLKESFMKATGIGMKLMLNSFEIVIADEISIRQSVDANTYSFREFDEISGYKCAICTLGKAESISFIGVDIKDILTGGKI